MNNDISLQVHNNFQLLQQIKETKTDTSVIDIYINTATGALKKIPPSDETGILSLTESRQWKQIKVHQSEGKLTFDTKSLEGLNEISQTVLIQSFKAEAFSEVTHDAVSSDRAFILQLCNQCFGDEAASEISKGSTLQEIAERIFEHTNNKLCSPVAIHTQEIKDIYRLLFETSLSPYANRETADDYHPATVIKNLAEAVKALEVLGKEARISTGREEEGKFGGVNGSYFITDISHNKLWVFKPENEEKEGVAVGIHAGESAKREHLACVLNYDDHVYPIPYTAYVELEGKIGSVQLFQNNCVGLSVLLTSESSQSSSELSKKQLQESLVFDIRFGNLDRHLGNLLVFRGEESEEAHASSVVMIDQGLCLSDSPEDPLKLEDLGLSQMSESWDPNYAQRVLNVDIEKDARILGEHGIPPETINRMKRATIFLQRALEVSNANQERGFSITPYDVGLIALKNSRAFWSDEGLEKALALLNAIIPSKEIAQKSKFSHAKMLMERKKFVVAHPEMSDIEVSCIFGCAQNDESSKRIDWSDSIIGKYTTSNKK